MNILSLKLTNFLSHVDTELDLSSNAPYLFIGENGAGKSSLVKDATTWALFAEARARGAGDDLIYNLEKTCKVEVIFDINGSTYRVVRQRERNKKTELSLFKKELNQFKDISNVIVTKTQQDLEKILGFTYKTFAVSACLEQNSRLNFSELTPKECKDTLMEILEIEKFNEYEKIAREKATRLEVEIKTTEDKIELTKQKLEKYKQVAPKLLEIKTRQTLLVKEKQEKETQQQALRIIVELKIKELEDTISSRQVEVETLRTSYKGKETELNSVAQTLTLAGAEINKLTQRLLKIKNLGSKCPTCESDLQHEHLNSIVEDVQKDLTEQQQIQVTNSPKFKTIQNELEEIETKGKNLSVLEFQKQLKEATSELSSLSTNTELSRIANEVMAIEKEVTRLETEVANEEEFKAEIEVDLKKIISIKEQLSDVSILQSAFSKNGIPAMIISNITNELEFSINSILHELTTKNISVKVATEKNLKSKDGLSDTLEIIIRNETLDRPYQLYSGGEKYRIDLAIRLAISKILARRNNFKLDTLIIDEPAGLDRVGLIQFKDTVIKLTRSFKKILIVSHLTELIEDTRGQFKLVTVKASNGVSTVFNT